MKRCLFFLLVIPLLLAGCRDYEPELDETRSRLNSLEDITAGLKVSDSIFGFVLFTQVDTITKGLKLPVTFRINPSGIPFSRDMVVLDNMVSTKYLVEEEVDPTKASYITESKNFYVDSLGKTRNAANEEMDGQYFIRLGNKETRNLIDDNTFALVGAYWDKNDAIQYVSTNPFQIVMMPTPAEGLQPWLYRHGSVSRTKEVTIPPAEEGGESTIRYERELGTICFQLDSRSYKQENGDAKKIYSTDKYIRMLSFEPATAADSVVVFAPVRDSGFVRFYPDTSKAEMAALMDTTQIRSITVRGKIHALDRFGGASEFPVEMTWYSSCRDTVTITKKVSDFFTTDEEGKEVRTGVLVDLDGEFKKIGFYAHEAEQARRKTIHHFLINGGTSRFLLTPNTGAASEEERYVTGIIKGMGAKDKMPGTYYLGAINSISVGPTKDGALHQEEQVMATVIVKLVVTE